MSPNHIISLCTTDNALAVNSWNPATGETHARSLGFQGTVEDQLPVAGGAVFLWGQSTCDSRHWQKETTWRVSWLTPQGLGSVVFPTLEDVRTVRIIKLSDDAVYILTRSPTHKRLGGYLVRRQNDRITLDVMPEIPVSEPGYAAVALDDHRVMLLGGANDELRGCAIASACLASTQILDVRRKSWTKGPDMLEPRVEAAAVRLPDGSVVVAGGWTAKDNWGVGPSRTAERWDPKQNVFKPLPPMPVGTALAKGTWLPGYEGRILLFATGTSAHLPAFDVEKHIWFDVGDWGMENPMGATGFFPFAFDGHFYAWQWYLDTPVGAAIKFTALRLPPDIVSTPH